MCASRALTGAQRTIPTSTSIASRTARPRGSTTERSAGRGDLIQLTYVAEKSKHGVVFSLDGAGSVTLHWPERPDGSTLLKTDGETPLLHAYELDAAPLYERFVFVTSDRPIDVNRVLKAARELASNARSAASASLEIPADWKQSDFTLKKVER